MPGTLLFMGHREDLLEGAKRCLLEKGYARTTARDIVAASGTNLASIGYHYGSKEALLNLAFVKVTEEWGDLLTDDGQERAEGDDASGPIDKDPELRKALLDPQREGRDGLAEGMLGIDPEKDPEKARVAGLFCQALLAGVMVQWLMDSESAPSAQDLTDGLKVVLEGRGGSTS
jgi:AcrR family transcriptional regulator